MLIMKKVFLLPLCAAAFAVSSHASFTETPTTISDVEGVIIAGTGSVSELSATSYNFAKFGGTTINFDNNDFLFQTTRDDLKIGSAKYSFSIDAASTINVTGTGGVQFGSATTADGGISVNAATTINIAEGSSGIVTGKIAVLGTTATLNLYKEDAFSTNSSSPTTLTNTGTININTDKNQSFRWDSRSGSTINFTITDGATVVFKRVTGMTKTDTTSTMNFTDGLVDGTLMFALSFVTSYDETLSQVVIHDSSSRVATINLTGLDDAATWTEEKIGGVNYLCISAIPVPEASTYAVIFGVAALGFAFYRRRK